MAAGNDKYTIPLGLETSQLTRDITSVMDNVDQLNNKTKDAGKSMQESFNKGGSEIDKAEAKIKEFTAGLDKVREEGRAVGKELATAFNTKGLGKDFDRAMDNFRKKMEAIANTPISLNVDDSKLKLLDAAIADSNGDLEELTANLETVKAVLDQLDPDSEEFKMLAEAVAYTETVFETFDEEVQNGIRNGQNLHATFQEVHGDLSPMSQRLKDVQNRLYEMSAAGMQNTEEFKKLQEEAAKFRKVIKEVDSATTQFAKRSVAINVMLDSLTGLTAAFTTVQGAVALFGEENEDLEKALIKVNGAMAVLQGIQAIANLLNKEGAISTALYRLQTISLTSAFRGQTAAMVVSTVATKALGLAMKALGIGIIVSLLVLLWENWDKVTASINKLLPAGQSLGKMFNQLKSIAVGVGNAIFQYLVMPFKAVSAAIQGDFDGFKKAITSGYSFKKNFTDAYNQQEVKNAEKHQRELEKKEIERLDREISRRKARGENVEKDEIALQKRRIANAEKESKDFQEQTTKLEDMEDAAYKRKQDKLKEDAKEAQKNRDDANKEALKRQKEAEEQLIKMTDDLAKAKIAAMKDGYDKEKAQIDADINQRIEDLKRETTLTAEATKAKNEMIELLEQEHANRINKLNEEETKKQLELRAKAEDMKADFMEEGREKELEILRLDHEARMREINEVFKDEEETRIRLQKDLEESTAREREKIKNEFWKKGIEAEEARQLLAIEMSSKYAIQNEKSERAKQIAILETKIEFAERTLNLLLSSGLKENAIEITQAKEAVNKLRKELKLEIEKNDGKGFDFYDFIGLGNISDKQKDAVKKAGNAAMESISQITDFMVAQYDRQINKKQETIDQADDDIKDLEKRLDEEKILQAHGLANSAEALEAELQTRRDQREKDLAEQQEIIKKKQAMQRAQMAVDSAVQLVNLVTASTEIFKSLSPLGPFGIAGAIATIGLMFSAFAAAKVQAFQAINGETEKFERGGRIGGKRHSDGGVKYYSDSGAVAELEDGEMVINRRRTNKYPNIAEKLNDPNYPLSHINDSELFGFLSELGISMSEETTKEEVSKIRKGHETYNFMTSGEYDKEIRDNLKILADRAANQTESWEDDMFFYIKKGNKTQKFKKR